MGGRAGHGVKWRKKKRELANQAGFKGSRKQKRTFDIILLLYVGFKLNIQREQRRKPCLLSHQSYLACVTSRFSCRWWLQNLTAAQFAHLFWKPQTPWSLKPWGCSCKLANLLFIFGRPGARRCALLPSPPPVQSLYLLIAFCRVYLGSFL